METIAWSTLRPGTYFNHNGEVIGMSRAQELIASGNQPVLYTVSDEWIAGLLLDLSRSRSISGEKESDVYTAPYPNAKRALYFPLPYCPSCGVKYSGLKKHHGKNYCSSPNHHGTRIALSEWQHERVELVSTSYEDGGLRSGDIGKVIDVKSTRLPSGQIQVDLRVEWESGAKTCWIGAEDFTEA